MGGVNMNSKDAGASGSGKEMNSQSTPGAKAASAKGPDNPLKGAKGAK